MGAIVARQDNFHKTSQMGRLPEMRGYDSDSSNLSCSTRGINSGLSASTAFRAFILNVPLLQKWTLVSETGKEAKDGLNETVTIVSGCVRSPRTDSLSS